MKNFWKRLGSAGVATALCLGMAQAVPAAVVSAADPLFSAECEDLTLSSDAQVATKVYNDEYPGYTGAGFVWVTSSGTMSFTIDAPETGMYRLMTRCIMYLGTSSSDIREAQVTVTRSDDSTATKTVKIAHTDDWNDYNWGDLKLTKGENTITFGGGWGYCLYDNMTLTQTPKPEYEKATATPVDPKATKETKALMSYLKSVYGSHIISGQQEIYGGGKTAQRNVQSNGQKNRMVSSLHRGISMCRSILTNTRWVTRLTGRNARIRTIRHRTALSTQQTQSRKAQRNTSTSRKL